MSQPGHGAPPPAVSGGKKRGLRSYWPNLVGWVIAAAALGYVLSRVQLSELSKELSGVVWWLVVAAILVEVLPRVLEAVRWRSLLQPICTRFRDLLQAIYIGTLYSAILPLSGGDVIRGVIVARTSAANVTQVLSTELVERVVDAIALVVLVWFALQGLALPETLRVVRIVLEVGVAIAVAGAVLLTVRRRGLLAQTERWNPRNRLLRRVQSVVIDLVKALGWVRPAGIIVAMTAAVGAAVINVAAYWLMLRAYHLPLSFAQAAGLFSIVMIGTFLPGTPGNVGTWQFFCTVGLQLFGIGSTRAAGFSLVAYFIWTIPPLLIGLVALVLSPFKWSEVRVGKPEQSTRTGGVCETGRSSRKHKTGGDA